MLYVLQSIRYPTPTQLFDPYQWYYDFAVRMRFEVVWFFYLLPKDPVVVDLTVDGQCERAIVVDQRLSSSILKVSAKHVLPMDAMSLPTPTILSRSWARTGRALAPFQSHA